MTKKIKTLLSTFREMWRHSSEAITITKLFSPWMVRLAYIISVVGGVQTLGSIGLVTLAYTVADARGIKVQEHLPTIFWIWIGFIVSREIFQGFLRLVTIRKRTAFKQFVQDHFTEVVHKKLTSLSLGTRMSGEFKKLHRRTGVSNIVHLMEEFFEMRFSLIRVLVGVGATLVALTFINLWLFLGVLIPALINTYFRVQHYREWYEERDKVNKVEQRKSEYERVLTNSLLYVQNSFFNTLSYFIGAFKRKREEEKVHELEQQIVEVKADMRTGWVQILPITIFCLSISSYINNMDLPKIFLLFGCYKTLQSSLVSVCRLYSTYDKSHLKMGDWNAFKNYPSNIDEAACTPYHPTETPNITLSDISFTYPDRDVPAISNLNLSIPPGQSVALVGHNGSGKSTTIALLTKLYLPQAGTVEYDERTTETVLQTDISKFVCWIAGNCDLLELPLYEAVCGCRKEEVDWERLRKAASITGADEYVQALTHGWNTSLDTTDEHHTSGFSDGQKQRLNLTAAMYRALSVEVKIIIFDEPMAHCDTDVKQRFYTEIQGLGKTVIAAIHDPSYHHLFDRVITLEDGQVTSDITK